MVAGDHRDANATAVALFDRLDSLSARWVQQPDQPKQNQVFW
jgi:hypothetical protein